jgi:hypothetical protein
MEHYRGIPGRAPYIQGSQIRQFTIWSRKDDGDAALYVYIPTTHATHDASLKLLCEHAVKVDSGFMVTVPRWEAKVTPEGVLIP